ncbi:cysteine and histidine-rich domain-containing protein morgana [Planococcus citri]|uniref:cysteine and histidine-rich domain-containing protein morgana n=1 Tax=Planococcus citri TaxID=170843 RepID=UPI0031F93A72
MGDSIKKLLHCYNKGCGKTFDPDDNPEGGCIYHGGVPYFHDAYKEWTCCNKKTTDFTEFLNIKGCTQGIHNGNRPKALDKPKQESNADLAKQIENMLTPRNDNRKIELARSSIPNDLPLVPISPEISPRLLQQLNESTQTVQIQVTEGGPIPIGTSCQNSGCTVSYDQGIAENCVHHPGTAIFHEGLKFWSCCRKMTSDFSKFLDQVGCTTGKHVWFKQKQAIQCRIDWHQTGASVVISVFAKNYDPHKSQVSLSPTRLKISIFFPKESEVFEKQYDLFGVIDVEKSCVSMLPTKVEIKLTKAYAETWRDISAPSK